MGAEQGTGGKDGSSGQRGPDGKSLGASRRVPPAFPIPAVHLISPNNIAQQPQRSEQATSGHTARLIKIAAGTGIIVVGALAALVYALLANFGAIKTSKYDGAPMIPGIRVVSPPASKPSMSDLEISARVRSDLGLVDDAMREYLADVAREHLEFDRQLLKLSSGLEDPSNLDSTDEIGAAKSKISAMNELIDGYDKRITSLLDGVVKRVKSLPILPEVRDDFARNTEMPMRRGMPLLKQRSDCQRALFAEQLKLVEFMQTQQGRFKFVGTAIVFNSNQLNQQYESIMARIDSAYAQVAATQAKVVKFAEEQQEARGKAARP